MKLKKVYLYDTIKEQTVISKIAENKLKVIRERADVGWWYLNNDLPEYSTFSIVKYGSQWYAVSKENNIIIDEFPSHIKSNDDALSALKVIGEAYQKSIKYLKTAHLQTEADESLQPFQSLTNRQKCCMITQLMSVRYSHNEDIVNQWSPDVPCYQPDWFDDYLKDNWDTMKEKSISFIQQLVWTLT